MRIEKTFGVRTHKLDNPEVKRKFLLVYEGEETEAQYFEGIDQNRGYLKINPLIELKPILRSFDEKGWSNPKKLLDRLVEFKAEISDDSFTIKSVIAKAIDYLIIDNVISNESLYSCQDIEVELTEYFSDIKRITNLETEASIDETTKDIIDCLLQITDLSVLIPKFEEYINSQNIVFDKEIDRICLIVDRDKESFVSNPGNDQYSYVVEKCNEHDIDFYLTNPCFEFWLLLHFDEVKQLDSRQLISNPKVNSKRRYVESELRKLVPGYKKSNIKFESFLNNIEKAIRNEKDYCEDIDGLKTKVGSNIASLIAKLRG